MPEPPGAPGAPGRAALLVFAKVPAAGAVKTRLVPPLTAEEAAALYEAFLADALAGYAAPDAFGEPVAVRLYLAGEAPAPPGLVPPRVRVHRQRGDGLGARMQRAFAEAFVAGYGRVVVVGTDHPTLPRGCLAEAFGALHTPRTVALGPSDDGGYYALGLNDRAFGEAGLFAMRYSHGAVFDETHRRARAAGARVVLLPPWYDVDDADGLRRLAAEVRRGGAVPPKTAARLAALLDVYPALL
jgi:rSAM/selenodomain-associated transferase 1